MNFGDVRLRIQTYTTAITKCGIIPMCSLRLSLGSVAVQNRASKMSCPNEENNLSAIYKQKMNNKERIIFKVNGITIFYPVLWILLTLLIILKLTIGREWSASQRYYIFFSCFVNLLDILFVLIFLHNFINFMKMWEMYFAGKKLCT